MLVGCLEMFAWLWHALLVAMLWILIRTGAGIRIRIGVRWGRRVFRLCVLRPPTDTRTRIADRCEFVGSNYRWSGVFFIVTAVMTTVGTYSHVQLIAFNLLDFISVSPWLGLRGTSFFWGFRGGWEVPKLVIRWSGQTISILIGRPAASGLWFLSMPLQLQLKCAIWFDFCPFFDRSSRSLRPAARPGFPARKCSTKLTFCLIFSSVFCAVFSARRGSSMSLQAGCVWWCRLRLCLCLCRGRIWIAGRLAENCTGSGPRGWSGPLLAPFKDKCWRKRHVIVLNTVHAMTLTLPQCLCTIWAYQSC